MPKAPRIAVGGVVYHVFNRANGRSVIFTNPEDYVAFENILAKAVKRTPMRVLAYCLMPNHWHMVLWPIGDGDLSTFLGWLTLTHAVRWHAARGTTGTGHLYQGRFKSFPVQTDRHFLTLSRYVERNPLRANLVPRAEQWRWGSLWRREFGSAEAKRLLSPWPVERSSDWVECVNQPLTPAETAAIQQCLHRGRPYGDHRYTEQTAALLRLESTLRSRGRPRK
jgi:putative transposase